MSYSGAFHLVSRALSWITVYFSRLCHELEIEPFAFDDGSIFMKCLRLTNLDTTHFPNFRELKMVLPGLQMQLHIPLYVFINDQ